MSDFFRSVGRFALVLVGGFVAWTGIIWITRWTFRAPDDARTILAMSKTDEPVAHLAKVVLDEKAHYVWLGRTVWLAAPSGPACYVFDARGALIASTPTTGDLELHQFCDAAWKRPALPLRTVLKEISLAR